MENSMNPFKTDRRAWNKSNQDLCLEYPDFATDVESNRSTESYQLKSNSTETKKKYEDHLFNLHLQNQLLKLCNQKDKETEQKEKLESGFSLYMNGAHKKEKFMPRHTVAKDGRKKRFINYSPNLLPNVNDLEALRALNQAQSSSSSNPTTERGRKKWNANMSSITIKTQDGANIKIKPNNSESTGVTPRKSDDSQTTEFMQFQADYYSYDFESDSSDPEEDQIPEEVPCEVRSSNEVKKSLIEDVKFSDDEEDDEMGGTIKLQTEDKRRSYESKFEESDDFS